MNKEHVVVGVLIEETTTISFNEVCVKYNISKELLTDLIEHGVFAPQPVKTEQTQLTSKELRRLESAYRLHKDLGVNAPGIALALELLDELEDLRKKLDIMNSLGT